jgi:hypothetical protein
VVECTAVDQERSARDLGSLVVGPISPIRLLVSMGPAGVALTWGAD